MLVGSYSITHLRQMYNDPHQRPFLEKYRNLFMFGAIIWLLALVLLIIYWRSLETWAKVIGIIGLLFNYGGSLFTLFVIFFGIKETNLPDPVPEMTLVPANQAAELINLNPSMNRMASPIFNTVTTDSRVPSVSIPDSRVPSVSISDRGTQSTPLPTEVPETNI